jgi:putative FmdB family regulatory protein
MPTYEYECDACGAHFERFQQMIEEAIKECPECGEPLRRLIGVGSGFIFKGSGFYATDYAKHPEKPECEKEVPCCGKDKPCEKKPCEE